MRFIVETVGGDELEVHNTLDEAVRGAVKRLEDDPELGALEVFEAVRRRPTARPGVFDLRRQLGRAPTAQEYRNAGDWDDARHVKTVTHGPNAHWDTVVVVLQPGEKIQPPGRVPRRITEDDLEGYELGDPKRASLEREIGTWI